MQIQLWGSLHAEQAVVVGIALLYTYWILAIGAVATVLLNMPVPNAFKEVSWWSALNFRATIQIALVLLAKRTYLFWYVSSFATC